MTISKDLLPSGPSRLGIASIAAVALLVALPTNAQAATAPAPLGTADSFVVLAGAGITNTGPTTLNGDFGTFPTTSVSGAGQITKTGTNHAGDAVTQQGKTDLVTAYNTAAGQGPTAPIADDLTGKTLKPGVYNSASSIGLSGALTLDAAGDPNAVFVFQAGSSLTTGSGSQVHLLNGAKACNVVWQIGSDATLGTGSSFVGTILAKRSITATHNAKVVGRALARNGAVTLDKNTITRPTDCATAAKSSPAPTPSPTTPAPSQVAKVPTGGVSAGDGSTNASADGGNTSQGLLVGLLFAGLSGAGFVAIRRRRLNS
jgi:hypothetical protein